MHQSTIARRWLRAAALASLSTFASVAGADTIVAPTGGSQPFDNRQPSLGLTYAVRTRATADRLGEVALFPTDFVPNGYTRANGALLPIAGNEVLFSKLGTAHGGNGVNTFALPNLRGRAVIGAGTGPGDREVGSVVGENFPTLTEAQMPAHGHIVAATPGHPSQFTGVTGGSQAFSNVQGSVALNFGIATTGNFPIQGGSFIASPYIGQVDIFAGTMTRPGFVPANGLLLPIGTSDALFQVTGTTFGGDGRSNFAVPDLTGRVPQGDDGRAPFGARGVGANHGAEQVQLTQAQLPTHAHPQIPPSELGAVSPAGGGQPFDNEQPSLSLRYLVAIDGTYPATETTQPGTLPGTAPFESPILGQLQLFATEFVPSGYREANGQVLQINQHEALFSLIGTTYGGDGRTTFALPDLRSYIAIGTDPSGILIGGTYGSRTLALSTIQMPVHVHSVAVPEPASLALAATCLLLLRRRRD